MHRPRNPITWPFCQKSTSLIPSKWRPKPTATGSAETAPSIGPSALPRHLPSVVKPSAANGLWTGWGSAAGLKEGGRVEELSGNASKQLWNKGKSLTCSEGDQLWTFQNDASRKKQLILHKISLYIKRCKCHKSSLQSYSWASMILKLHAEGKLSSIITKLLKIKLHREKHHFHFTSEKCRYFKKFERD